MRFKNFLINEQHEYFSQKVGNILTGVHELVQANKQIGARLLVKHSEDIVNQIRKVLHSSWYKSETKYLKKLQKCGVALAKTIEEKGDLNNTLNSVRHELEQLSHKLGEPINTLASPKPKAQKPAPQPQEPQQPQEMPQNAPEQ